MRKLLSRVVAAVAGGVYDWGVRLYRLSDWIEGSDERVEPKISVQTGNSNLTTNVVGTITWSGSGRRR